MRFSGWPQPFTINGCIFKKYSPCTTVLGYFSLVTLTFLYLLFIRVRFRLMCSLFSIYRFILDFKIFDFFGDFSLYFILSSHSTFLFQLQFFLQSSLMKLKQTLTGYEKENKDPSWISVAILSQNSSFLSIKCIHEILGFVIYFLHPLQISSNFLLDLM